MSPTIIDVLAPLVADARSLVDLRRELSTAFPAADSPAMAERVDDAKLADVWSDQPVTDAQNYVLMLICVAEDHLECMCRLLDRPGFAPVWGLAPIARSLLEAAGRAAHMGDVGLGARGRVEAYVNERLFSLDQISDLPAGAKDPEGIRRQRDEVVESALRKGFVRKPHHDPAKAATGTLASPRQLGIGRPGDLEVVRRLFDPPPELGKGIFQWVSAATHATGWEVEKHFSPINRNALGFVSLEVGRDPGEIHQLLDVAVKGYVEMVGRFWLLWGVRDIRWLKSALNSIRISGSVGELIQHGASP